MAAGGGGAHFNFHKDYWSLSPSETEPGSDHVTLHHMRGGEAASCL